MGYTPPWLNVVKGTGKYTVYPPGISTDDLTIYPNPVDTTSSITLLGLGAVVVDLAANQVFLFTLGGTNTGYIAPTATELDIYTYSNKDVGIYPNGNGRLRFGAYVNTPATDSTGYIEIKDAAGTTRKVMIQA